MADGMPQFKVPEVLENKNGAECAPFVLVG
jgi:hypothetical protein